MRGRRVVGVTLLAMAATGCAPAPRIVETAGSDGGAGDGSSFRPFTPDGAGASVVGAPDPDLLVSDFEQAGAAVVVDVGAPPRHGAWYAYNDGSQGCQQDPAPGAEYVAATPPLPSPGGGKALRALWHTCWTWGAGVAAQLNSPAGDGGAAGLVPYDLTGFTGVSFHAMAAPLSDGLVRVMFPMIDDTQNEFGGTCDEAVVGAGRCNDAYEQMISLPADGMWRLFTVSFSNTTFRQEGWGAPFAWKPSHVTTIQFQSASMGGPHDFWIDDVYLTR